MKNFFKTAGLVLLYVSVYLLAQIIVGIAFGVVYAFKIGFESSLKPGGQSNDPANAFSVENISRFVTENLSWIVLVSILIAMITYWVVFIVRQENMITRCSFKKMPFQHVILAMILGLSMNFIVGYVLTLLSQIKSLGPVFADYEKMAGQITGGSNLMLVLLTTGIIVPVFEEFLFRGLVFNELKGHINIKAAIVIQAVIFGLVHLNVVQGAYAAAIGLILGYIYYWSGSLFASILVHMVLNSSSILLEQDFLQGALEKYGEIFFAAGFVLFLLSILYMWRSRKKLPRQLS